MSDALAGHQAFENIAVVGCVGDESPAVVEAADDDTADRSGFAVVQHSVEDPQCGGHTVWLAQEQSCRIDPR